jgi:Tfp pilus assembly protein PilF
MKTNDFQKRRALQLWEEGQDYHINGDLDRALSLYSQSLAVCPTAEAHTFRGWAFSYQGKLEEAIDECMSAIEVDPSMGNPYNDIGSYLITLGRPDDAVEWLERAKSAKRYDVRHYPCMNLGRIYAAKGLALRAIREFEEALEYAPDEPRCLAAIQELRNSIQ